MRRAIYVQPISPSHLQTSTIAAKALLALCSARSNLYMDNHTDVVFYAYQISGGTAAEGAHTLFKKVR